MIVELQNSVFVRDEIDWLLTLTQIGEIEGAEITQEDLDFSGGALRDLSPDFLWNPPSENWHPDHAYAALLQSTLDVFYRVNDWVIPDDNTSFGERLRPELLRYALRRTVGRLREGYQDNRAVIRGSFAIALRLRTGMAQFINVQKPVHFAHNSRVILVADFGGGLSRAVKMMQMMDHNFIQPALEEGREMHLMHLGDVYESGNQKEYNRNLLAPWPVSGGVNSWCLPGNHDLYSGGHAYFALVTNHPRFQHQGASFFLLENDDWQVFGLDTASDPPDLRGSQGNLTGGQPAWVGFHRGRGAHKKCVFLTHHQPFSSYERAGEQMGFQLAPLLGAGIKAWFWGHEHRCAIYDPQMGIEVPVLIGNGGYLERPFGKKPAGVAKDWNWTHTDGTLLFGFAVLDFSGSQIDVRLVDENGTVRISTSIV